MVNKQLEKEEIIQVLKRNINEIKKFSVKRLGLFGSFSRNEQNEDSDLDFLVEFEEPSLRNFMGLNFFLENLFARKVDLVTYRSLHELIKKRVLSEEVEVLWMKEMKFI